MAEIQPLHQRKPQTTTNALLKKKLMEKSKPSLFASPTDKMLSPCTQKLNNHKNRFFSKSAASKLNLSTRISGKNEEEVLKAKKKEIKVDEELLKNVDLDDI